MGESPPRHADSHSQSIERVNSIPTEDTDQNEQSKPYLVAKFCILFAAYVIALTVASISRLTQVFINWVLTEER